jgi:uncharacterized protein (DUF488 family)
MKSLQNTAHTQTTFVELENAQLPKILITGTSQKRVIYTIGHSTKSLTDFAERLKAYEIDRVIDVRTKPYSRWCPQFNRNQLEVSLAEIDINYDWRGNNLGGLADNVDYDKTLQWVLDRAKYENIALMCSEGDYHKCHRYLMLTPDLLALGMEVRHITY